MIRTFKCRDTEEFFNTRRTAVFNGFAKVAYRKLVQLDAAQTLASLKVPPGNKLEALKGHRLSQHSIRINDQFRICFEWSNGDAYNVEIVDYH